MGESWEALCEDRCCDVDRSPLLLTADDELPCRGATWNGIMFRRERIQPEVAAEIRDGFKTAHGGPSSPVGPPRAPRTQRCRGSPDNISKGSAVSCGMCTYGIF